MTTFCSSRISTLFLSSLLHSSLQSTVQWHTIVLYIMLRDLIYWPTISSTVISTQYKVHFLFPESTSTLKQGETTSHRDTLMSVPIGAIRLSASELSNIIPRRYAFLIRDSPWTGFSNIKWRRIGRGGTPSCCRKPRKKRKWNPVRSLESLRRSFSVQRFPRDKSLH